MDLFKAAERKLDHYLSAGNPGETLPVLDEDPVAAETPFTVMVDRLNSNCMLDLPEGGGRLSISKSWPPRPYYSWTISFSDGAFGYIAPDGDQSLMMLMCLPFEGFLKCRETYDIRNLSDLKHALMQTTDYFFEYRLPDKFCIRSDGMEAGMEFEEPGWNWEFSLVRRHEKVWSHSCGAFIFTDGFLCICVKTNLVAHSVERGFYEYWTVYRTFNISSETYENKANFLNDFLAGIDWTNVHDEHTCASTACNSAFNGSVPFNLDVLDSIVPGTINEYISKPIDYSANEFFSYDSISGEYYDRRISELIKHKYKHIASKFMINTDLGYTKADIVSSRLIYEFLSKTEACDDMITEKVLEDQEACVVFMAEFNARNNYRDFLEMEIAKSTDYKHSQLFWVLKLAEMGFGTDKLRVFSEKMILLYKGLTLCRESYKKANINDDNVVRAVLGSGKDIALYFFWYASNLAEKYNHDVSSVFIGHGAVHLTPAAKTFAVSATRYRAFLRYGLFSAGDCSKKNELWRLVLLDLGFMGLDSFVSRNFLNNFTALNIRDFCVNNDGTVNVSNHDTVIEKLVLAYRTIPTFDEIHEQFIRWNGIGHSRSVGTDYETARSKLRGICATKGWGFVFSPCTIEVNLEDRVEVQATVNSSFFTVLIQPWYSTDSTLRHQRFYVNYCCEPWSSVEGVERRIEEAIDSFVAKELIIEVVELCRKNRRIAVKSRSDVKGSLDLSVPVFVCGVGVYVRMTIDTKERKYSIGRLCSLDWIKSNEHFETVRAAVDDIQEYLEALVKNHDVIESITSWFSELETSEMMHIHADPPTTNGFALEVAGSGDECWVMLPGLSLGSGVEATDPEISSYMKKLALAVCGTVSHDATVEEHDVEPAIGEKYCYYSDYESYEELSHAIYCAVCSGRVVSAVLRIYAVGDGVGVRVFVRRIDSDGDRKILAEMIRERKSVDEILHRF